MAFEAPPMETLLSSFFNISPTDSFVCLFIKIYCNQQDLGRKGERGGEGVCVRVRVSGTKRGQKRGEIRGRREKVKKGRTRIKKEGRRYTKKKSHQEENRNIPPSHPHTQKI